MSGGTKNDQDKVQLDLLSTRWLMGVGAVLTFGAKKYAAHNWRKGIKISRLVAAALRHILAFNAGQDLDPETGLFHLYHASCCLMFAAELMETRRQEVDDRYRPESSRCDVPWNEVMRMQAELKCGCLSMTAGPCAIRSAMPVYSCPCPCHSGKQ